MTFNELIEDVKYRYSSILDKEVTLLGCSDVKVEISDCGTIDFISNHMRNYIHDITKELERYESESDDEESDELIDTITNAHSYLNRMINEITIDLEAHKSVSVEDVLVKLYDLKDTLSVE